MDKEEIRRIKEAQKLSEEVRRAGGARQYIAEVEDMRKAALLLQKPLKEINEFNKIGRQILKNHLPNLKVIREIFSAKFHLPKELLQFDRRFNQEILTNQAFLKDLNRSFGMQLEEINSIFAPLKEVRESLLLSGRQWARTMEALPNFKNGLIQQQILESSLTWQIFTDTVSHRINDLNLLKSHPYLSTQLMQPGIIYGNYSTQIAERIEQSSDEKEINALSGSLTLAQEQLEGSIQLSPDVVVVPEDDDVQLIIVPIYNSFTVQEQELLACDFLPAEKTYEILLTHSIAGQIAEKSRCCVELALYCNKANKVRGGNDIFKPTTKFTESCSLLPYTIAKDQTTLQIIVEHLYFILYEGAGKDHLRFLDESFVSDLEMDAVMYVKFLRNKWLSHDADHGDESKIRRTWRNLSEALADLGVAKLPQNPDEYTDLQMRLLNSVEAFLRLLADRITNKAEESERVK